MQPALQVEQVVLQAGPHDGIDRAVGLVHQQHGRIGGQGPGDAHALLLTTGQGGRVAAEHGRVEADEFTELVDPRSRALLVPPEELRDGGDVVADRAVGEQPDLLDDVADASTQLVVRQGGGVDAVDEDAAFRGRDEPVDHLQDGRLAAARRADHGHELPRGDVEIEGVDRGGLRTGIALGDVLQPYRGHDGIAVDVAHASSPLLAAPDPSVTEDGIAVPWVFARTIPPPRRTPSTAV